MLKEFASYYKILKLSLNVITIALAGSSDLLVCTDEYADITCLAFELVYAENDAGTNFEV